MKIRIAALILFLAIVFLLIWGERAREHLVAEKQPAEIAKMVPPGKLETDYLLVDIRKLSPEEKLAVDNHKKSPNYRLIYSGPDFLLLKKERAVTVAGPRAQFQVINGGFEDVYGDIPKEWRLELWQSEGTTCEYLADNRVRKFGRFSAKIVNDGPADSRWVQDVDVWPNTEYKLSGWIKTVNVLHLGEGAVLNVADTPLKTKGIFDTTDWQYVEVIGKTGPKQKRVKVECRLGFYGATNIGTAYFDEVKLEPVKTKP